MRVKTNLFGDISCGKCGACLIGDGYGCNVTDVRRSDLEAMRAALKWYADENNWTRTGNPCDGDPISVAEGDGGQRARTALRMP